MKKNYNSTLKAILMVMVMIAGLTGYAQDIHFTFANPQNTNDGANDFYEVDVMIQTVNTTGSFKLGSGQLYFNYNTAAFGTSVSGSGGFEVTYDNAGGYICGQDIDIVPNIKVYGGFVDNDNTTSKVSWAFTQIYSSSTFAADNVTDTPTRLAHLKIQYVDVLEEPMVTFEEGAAFDDQFFTACGLAAGGPTATVDCTTEPGTQLMNDTFDSAGATLSDDTIALPLGISIYPNPASDVINIKSTNAIDAVEMYDLLGKQVLRTTAIERIPVSQLPSGVYLLKVYATNGNLTKKVIIE